MRHAAGNPVFEQEAAAEKKKDPNAKPSKKDPTDDANQDPKTRLQEWLQARKLRVPEYVVVATRGEIPPPAQPAPACSDARELAAKLGDSG